MATKRKQTPADHENVPTKQQKTQEPAASKPLELLDLNVDCLEPIFAHLDAVDLLTMAKLDARLNAVAHMQFAARYAKHTLTIGQYGVSIADNSFVFWRLTEFLEEFGPQLRSIRIETSMVEILLHLIGHTLANVRDVTVAHCRLDTKMSKFNHWFPRMERLTLRGVNAVDSACIRAHFPALVDLTIEAVGPTCSVPRQFSAADVQHVLRHNPQLRSIRLNVTDGSPLLLDIATWCPHVERLSLSCDTEMRFPPAGEAGDTPQADVYGSVKTVHLDLWNYAIGTLSMLASPCVSGQVHKWMEFVMRRHLIEHWPLPLPLNGLHDGSLLRMSRLFPNVERVSLFGDLHMFSGNGLTTFVDGLKRLQSIRFELMDADLLNALRQQIDTTRWSIEEGREAIARPTVDDETQVYRDIIVTRVAADGDQ